MGINWTDSQRKVIDTRDKNILVSAAAGSGKTAVLVQRIVEKLLDKNHPTDIDKFLIVTFTNAAAAEMKEKIRNAIDDALDKNPQDENLLRQSTLVHKAQISTIDSFCLNVLKNEFHKIDLNPNFRIASEDEMKLLKSDVLDQVLEDEYDAADDKFLNLVESLTPGKNDDRLKDVILELFSDCMSEPWPKKWLKGEAISSYMAENMEEMAGLPWMISYFESRRETARAAYSDILKCKKMAQLPGMEHLLEQACEESQSLEALAEAKDIFEFEKGISQLKFAQVKTKRKADDEIKALQEEYMFHRNSAKAIIKVVAEEFEKASLEDTFMMISEMKPIVTELVAVTEKFMDAFRDEKANRAVLDFNDLEHLTLNILVDENTGMLTETAKEYSKRFDEIMIDEYQDSNMLQEYILNAVSGAENGSFHMFMVGDVKQSIYSFRQARPELFVKKYESYSDSDGDNIKIELDSNFRSRDTVIGFTNSIFTGLMKKDIGNVEYDDRASLKYGADYNEALNFEAEVCAVDVSDELWADTKVKGDADKEGAYIASRIRRLIESGTKVNCRGDEEGRPIRFSDIVVLFRSFGNHSKAIANQLRENGIPVHEISKSGYFKTTEVTTILNLLRIVDNPLQDIPMASVMHSPIGKFDNEQLALIRAACSEKESFSHGVVHFADLKLDKELKQKIEGFTCLLKSLRQKSKELTIYELLSHILETTGYLSIATVMPYGYQRRANLMMLLEKAKEFENTSYSGLFHFIRYVDQLIKYDIDTGEADAASENENAVRFVTIHKSKGLEYPVVFVAGMGRKFNKRDSYGDFVVHSAYGIGINYLNPNRRIKCSNMLCNMIKGEIAKDSMGEELRVLYVAFTRAKEKLIVTGCVKDFEKSYEKWSDCTEDGQVSYIKRLGAVNFLDLIGPAAILSSKYDVNRVGVLDIICEEGETAASRAVTLDNLLEDKITDLDLERMIAMDMEYVYPYKTEANQKVKYSVSEIKYKFMDRYDDDNKYDEPTQLVYPIADKEESSEQKRVNHGDKRTVSKGALRGTAMHRAMECFDLVKIIEAEYTTKAIEDEINRCLWEGLFGDDTAELLEVGKLEIFYRSKLAQRMAAAEKRGDLYREKPFVMGIAAKEADSDSSSDEMALVQGIIDAYFIENGNIVVLDYKTDKVQNERDLIGHYEIQLDLYGKALHKALGADVTEKILYSFCLGKEIKL